MQHHHQWEALATLHARGLKSRCHHHLRRFHHRRPIHCPHRYGTQRCGSRRKEGCDELDNAALTVP
jgi:hypothetical protein